MHNAQRDNARRSRQCIKERATHMREGAGILMCGGVDDAEERAMRKTEQSHAQKSGRCGGAENAEEGRQC